MSADLLADLDSFYSSGTTQNTPATTTSSSAKQTTSTHANDFLDFGSWNSPASQPGPHQAPLSNPAADDAFNDDWGDFETGQQEASQFKVNNVNPWPSNAGISSATFTTPALSASSDQQYWPRPSPLHVSEAPKPRKVKQPAARKVARDDSVFFDAEDEIDDGNDDDDFGDFATSQHGSSTAAPQVTRPPVGLSATQAQLSLLDFGDESAANATVPPQTSTIRSMPADFGWDAFDKPVVVNDASRRFGAMQKTPQARAPPSASTITSRAKTPTAPQPRITPQSRTVQNDDAWDDFEEGVPASSHKEALATDPTHLDTASAPLPLTSMLDQTLFTSQSEVAPSNIPPPAVLLSLFPPLIKLAQVQLFDHLAEQNSPATRTAILEHSSTQSFLRSFIEIATVLARIIAGRKLRWKRDTLLAQSMRIGPASASGKSGGMKLAGVDKAENAKEEREVADVLRIWRAQLGKLRSATTNVKKLPPIPEITEMPLVRVAKENEGGISSPKQCIVCALKRNERVAKVDVEVGDMFGEWWIDHWGHRTCVAFWRANESKLRSR